MNASVLYEIYQDTRNYNFKDLTQGVGQYHADHPGQLSHEEDKAIREFVGRHGQRLAVAFCGGYEAFAAEVCRCIALDKAEAER